MPRAGRQNVAGGIYHVTARGNAQEAIFLDELDYVALLRLLSATVERYSWRCHSYCLLPNHYHLLLETPEPNLSRGMLLLNGSYAGGSMGATNGSVTCSRARTAPTSFNATSTCSRCAAISP